MYGSVWKFVISEYDQAEQITRTITTSSTYGANFGIDPTTELKTKFGPKFGISATNTQSKSVTYVTTTDSDNLGEAVLDFRSPVIKSGPGFLNTYKTYEITTGILSLSIEPDRVY